MTSKYVLENPWYKVRQDDIIRPNGEKGAYNVVECEKGVFILAFTDEGKLLLIKLFRYPTQREGWEIPGGSIDQGEHPLDAAKRELQEETGFAADNWRHVGEFDAFNGITNAVSFIYIATGLHRSGEHMQEEEGITAIDTFTLDEVMEMIGTEKVVDGGTIAALMKALVAVQAWEVNPLKITGLV